MPLLQLTPTGSLTPSISLIFAATVGALSVIGALITGVITVIKASRLEYHDNIRNEKLDHITLLVDGRYSQVLQELADVKHLLALSSGKPSDRRAAEAAQIVADGQTQRVVAAESAKSANAQT